MVQPENGLVFFPDLEDVGQHDSASSWSINLSTTTKVTLFCLYVCRGIRRPIRKLSHSSWKENSPRGETKNHKSTTEPGDSEDPQVANTASLAGPSSASTMGSSGKESPKKECPRKNDAKTETSATWKANGRSPADTSTEKTNQTTSNQKKKNLDEDKQLTATYSNVSSNPDTESASNRDAFNRKETNHMSDIDTGKSTAIT